MKVFCCFSKEAIWKKFSTKANVFISKKKKHVQVAFKKSFPDYEYFDLILSFFAEEWEKWKIFFCDYELIYLRLITSLKWHFNYAFFERKKKKGKCA